MNHPSHRFSVAPMMDWTDRWCRLFHRSLTRHARLYTEMLHANAVLRGDRLHLLGFDAREHPVAVQLGGSDPALLRSAARICEDFGYDEINLNVGCPSERVQSGAFGACLMATPDTVAECVQAMSDAVSVPVTVKHRIGIDDRDSEEALHAFVRTVAEAGCRTFLVHARKAWLKGLSPRENREIPPLDYGRVYRLKAAYPALTIVLNGGLQSVAQAREALGSLDGVMMGRAAYQDPFVLTEVDPVFFGDPAPVANHAEAIEACVRIAEDMAAAGVPLSRLLRHVLGLLRGQPGARQWRRMLTETAARSDVGPDVIRDAFRATRPDAEI